MIVNCDIGERGPDYPVDIALMDLIQMANIACGGHAGNQESVDAFRSIAEKNHVKIAAHLSYPDPDNFGRMSMDISMAALKESLNEQIKLLPNVFCVKFHGALYNDSVVKPDLAVGLTEWLREQKMQEIVTPYNSELSKCCEKAGISCLYEAFAERRYAYDPNTDHLTLVSRQKDYASITDCQEAMDHSRSIIKQGQVLVHIEDKNGKIKKQMMDLKAETLCIHSDSKIALELAKKLKELITSLENH